MRLKCGCAHQSKGRIQAKGDASDQCKAEDLAVSAVRRIASVVRVLDSLSDLDVSGRW